MACKIDSHYTDGINCLAFDSLNCKGCCSGESSKEIRDRNHVNTDLYEESKKYAAEKIQYPVGICACCKEPPCPPFPKSCQNFGRPVLVYEIPSPKFEGKTTHQRDFVPKPVPIKELPPWHPILKNRWKAVDVPSLNKTTYRSDYTPQVATQECRKPVYLAPREKKDRCEELSEAFQAWRLTSKGPSKTYEVCDKPLVLETTLICMKPVPSSDHHHHEDSCYRNVNDTTQLHGPECEKHCSSTPLMCHVPPQSHDEDSHVVLGENLPVLQECTVAVSGGNVNDLNNLPTDNRRHVGLLDCENPLAQTCVTMSHPAGDGYACSSKRDIPLHYPPETSQDVPHKVKHVHFASEPEIICNSPAPRMSDKYQSRRSCQNAPNFMKSPCLTSGSVTDSNAFTLCEDMSNRQPKYWWKTTNCEPKSNDLEVSDVPRDITKPFCPSYLTVHKRDYTEPCQEKQFQGVYKDLSPTCGCSGNLTEKYLCPEFERGGLI